MLFYRPRANKIHVGASLLDSLHVHQSRRLQWSVADRCVLAGRFALTAATHAHPARVRRTFLWATHMCGASVLFSQTRAHAPCVSSSRLIPSCLDVCLSRLIRVSVRPPHPESRPLALDESLDAVVDIQVADIGVRLPDADKDNGLARRVHERQRRTDLVIDRVEFGEHDTVDQPRLARG